MKPIGARPSLAVLRNHLRFDQTVRLRGPAHTVRVFVDDHCVAGPLPVGTQPEEARVPRGAVLDLKDEMGGLRVQVGLSDAPLDLTADHARLRLQLLDLDAEHLLLRVSAGSAPGSVSAAVSSASEADGGVRLALHPDRPPRADHRGRLVFEGFVDPELRGRRLLVRLPPLPAVEVEVGVNGRVRYRGDWPDSTVSPDALRLLGRTAELLPEPSAG